MPYGLYLSAEGAQAQSRRVEIIANNLANVDTAGFKRELATCQARYAEAVASGSQQAGSRGIDDLGGGVMVRDTKTDFSAGPLRRTGNPNDVAVDGDGFFVVRKGTENMLTRAGNFRINARGELLTQQGYPVLSDGGSPIVINLDGGPWEVDASGAVRQRGVTPQNLALVKPASFGDLSKAGENLFRCAGNPQPVKPEERQVASGHLELSAVSPTLEMVQLIEASRLFEANVNLMKAQDQMLGGLISRVLRV